jgi:alkanesulfonate monooxygenase SsuD/methylene tetrahydromethanopterin reductase-like flavin-dependent oxidoreductase (luciferase family)
VKPSAASLKQIGIWTGAFERQPASKVQEAGAELEKLGYGAIWFSEGMGREAFTQAALLLAGSSRILVATGIANIYGRDPFTMAAGQKTLSEAYQSRFLLGLGVSHGTRCLAIIATQATGFQATGFHWVSFIRLNIRAYRCCVQA